MTADAPAGRRERKKAATRQAIADAALELFLARGFDRVSIRDVAEAADVATTTVFKHFASKEALVFDRDNAVEAELTAAVRGRPAGQDVLEALRLHALSSWVPVTADPGLAELATLVEQTPALQEHVQHMWARHAEALAVLLAQELGREASDPACSALARFVLQVPTLIGSAAEPRAAADAAFDLLTQGWRAHTDR
ncbi:MAG: TetR/AcrR family transcriptional regulator [Janthinobacterium lividum]